MGKIVYLTGTTVNGRQDLLFQDLARRKYPPLLYLLSTRGKVIEYEGDPRFWLNGWVDTLSGLVHRIFETCIKYERFNTFRPIDEGLRNLLIKKVIEDRSRQPDGLSYLSSLLAAQNKEQDYPGIYRSIAGFFSLLIRNNQQDRFADVLGKLSAEPGRPFSAAEHYTMESDLIWLFGDYEELKSQIGVYDDDDVLKSVRGYLQGDEIPSCLIDREIIILDNPTHFLRIEEDILEGLFRRVKEVWWLMDKPPLVRVGPYENPVPFSDKEKGDPSSETVSRMNGCEIYETYEAFRLFKPVYAFMNRLEKQGMEKDIKQAKSESLSHPLGASLFFDNSPIVEGNKRNIQFKSYPERVTEVKAIASEIKKINYENNLAQKGRLGRVRVIFPQLQDYASIIFEVFPEYGIPFSLTRGLPLSAHPLSNLFLNLIQIPLNRFGLDDVFQLLTLDYIAGSLSLFPGPKAEDRILRALKYPLFQDDTDKLSEYVELTDEELPVLLQENIFLLERVCRRCGIKSLNNILTAREEEEVLRVREIYHQSIQQERAFPEREKLKREYYQFLTIIDPLKDLLKPFTALVGQSEPQDIGEFFFSLLKHLHFPDIILAPGNLARAIDPYESTRVVKRDVKAFNLLKRLILSGSRELALAVDLFQIENPRELLAEFYTIFRSRIQFSYLYDERNPNVVRVSEWLEIRERSFDYIFAGGLTADQFPLKEETNFLLSESTYRPFRQLDPIEQSKYLFSHLLRNYGKRLYLSWPRFIEEKEARPTPILFDIKSLLGPNQSGDDLSELETILKWEENSYYSSEDDLYNFKGESAEEHPEMDILFKDAGKIIIKNQSKKEGITRGIKLLSSRLAEDGLFEYDGQIRMANRFQDYLKTKSNIFSPSQLELLANCPMRYLFERLFDLQPLEEPGDELTAREIGTHIHVILKQFFDRLKRMKANVYELGLAQSFTMAREIGEDHFKRHTFPDRFTYLEYQKGELLMGLDKDPMSPEQALTQREGILAQLLRFEARALNERLPQGLEYSFGVQEGTLVSLGKGFVRGYVDRFDVDKHNNERVYIYDYKTGQPQSLERIKKGLSFQLPAYMAALKQLHHFNKITAAFYSLRLDKLKEGDPFSQVLREYEENNKGLDMSGVQIIGDYVDHLMALMEEGSFHHSTDELQCEFCDFRYTCYRDNRRMNFLINIGPKQKIYSGQRNLEQWKEIDAFRKKIKDVNRSLEKSFSLKTEQARQKHREAVRLFCQWLKDNKEKLPISSAYLDEIIQQLDVFNKGVSAEHQNS